MASSVGKILDKPGTEASMSRYLFLPRGASKIIAGFFPYIELAVGALLLLGLFTRLAAIAAVLLFILFTGLVLYDLTGGRNQACHCFGRLSDEKLTPMAVVRNLMLMLLSALLIVAFDGWLSIDAALNNASNSNLDLIARNDTTALPPVGDAIPVVLLAMAAVVVIVIGGQVVSSVRTTLRGISFR